MLLLNAEVKKHLKNSTFRTILRSFLKDNKSKHVACFLQHGGGDCLSLHLLFQCTIVFGSLFGASIEQYRC